MKSIHRPLTLGSFSHLIGTPYSELDCWGIARKFYLDVFNIQLYRYYEDTPKGQDAAELAIACSTDFTKVDYPQFGDIILLRLNGLPSHVGIYLNRTQFLHTRETTGCIIDRLQKWKLTIEGFYRWQE